MKITPKALKTFQAIETTLFFGMKIGETKSIKSLASEETREAFLAYITMFIRSNRGFLGGFQIGFVDDERTAIKKVAHTWIDQKKGEDGNLVIDVDRYQVHPITKLPKTTIGDFRAALSYG